MIGRVLCLAAATIAYWLCALTMVGMLIFYDCFDDQACRAAQHTTFVTAMGLALVGYLLAMWAMIRALFPRPDA